MNKRCIVLIDGNNFYFKLKDLKLHNLLHFDFKGFAQNLAGKDRTVNTCYYVGAVKTDGTKHSQELFDNQRHLLAHLRNCHIRYTLGYLLKSDGIFHEKGVDVNIAVDMLVAVYENKADHLILVSSDTDLLPAVKKAKQKGKTVEYIGFSHNPSLAMIANCTESRLLKKAELEPFVLKTKK